MTTPDLTNARWSKSSHSSANGQCVEVAFVGSRVAIRDSKNPGGEPMILPATAWVSLLRG